MCGVRSDDTWDDGPGGPPAPPLSSSFCQTPLCQPSTNDSHAIRRRPVLLRARLRFQYFLDSQPFFYSDFQSPIANCQSAILLPLSRNRLDSRQRLLLLANALDCVNLAERQFEIQTEKRFAQAGCFGAQLVFTHIAILLDLFASSHY